MVTVATRNAAGRAHMRGAVMVEHALVMPLLVLVGVAALFYCIYAVTQLALEGDVARVVERAVRVSPGRSASVYCGAVDAFVRRAFEDSQPFYAVYVNNLRVTGVTGVTGVAVVAAPGADGRRVLSVTRRGDFKLLNAQALGLPLTLSATASALLPRSNRAGACPAAT